MQIGCRLKVIYQGAALGAKSDICDCIGEPANGRIIPFLRNYLVDQLRMWPLYDFC